MNHKDGAIGSVLQSFLLKGTLHLYALIYLTSQPTCSSTVLHAVNLQPGEGGGINPKLKLCLFVLLGVAGVVAFWHFMGLMIYINKLGIENYVIWGTIAFAVCIWIAYERGRKKAFDDQKKWDRERREWEERERDPGRKSAQEIHDEMWGITRRTGDGPPKE